ATCDARRRPASNRAAASVAPLVLLVRARSPDLVAAALRPEIRLAFYRDQEVDRLQHAAHGRIVRQLARLVHLAETQGLDRGLDRRICANRAFPQRGRERLALGFFSRLRGLGRRHYLVSPLALSAAPF